MDVMECSALGLRERKKRATRAALREAACRLVLERGLAAVTVEDVAAAADVSPRTFFNYFATKEEALLGRPDDVFAAVVTALREPDAGRDPLGALRAVLPQVVADIGSNRAQWQLRMDVVRANPQLVAHLLESFSADERRLAEAVATGTGLAAHDPYPLLVAAHVMASFRVSIAVWTAQGCDASLQDTLDAALTTLAAGLPVPVVHQ